MTVPRRSPRDVLDDWRLALAENGAAAARAIGRGASAGAAVARSAGSRARGTRLPHWPDARSVVVTSIVTGLLACALGWITLELFAQIFGVKSGGGWGVLAFALIAVAGFFVARTVLRWFGHPSAVVVAGLGQLLIVVLLVLLLPTDAQSLWSLVIVPAVSLVAYLGAHAAALVAEAEAAGDVDDDAGQTADERIAAH